MFGWSSGPYGHDASVPAGVPEPDQDRALVLYKYDACPFCIRVMRRIDQLGLAEQITMRDTRTEPGAGAELRRVTGRSQVPCMFIDDVPLFESADIIAWLEAYAKRSTA